MNIGINTNDEDLCLADSATTFRYLISLVAQEGLNLHLMDVVTAYLYGSLGNDIYVKLLKDLMCPIKQILKRIIQ